MSNQNLLVTMILLVLEYVVVLYDGFDSIRRGMNMPNTESSSTVLLNTCTSVHLVLLFLFRALDLMLKFILSLVIGRYSYELGSMLYSKISK